jgi:hypothetical protein
MAGMLENNCMIAVDFVKFKSCLIVSWIYNPPVKKYSMPGGYSLTFQIAS